MAVPAKARIRPGRRGMGSLVSHSVVQKLVDTRVEDISNNSACNAFVTKCTLLQQVRSIFNRLQKIDRTEPVQEKAVGFPSRAGAGRQPSINLSKRLGSPLEDLLNATPGQRSTDGATLSAKTGLAG